jgi:carotenoid cleavage dioxygenase
MTGKLEHGMAVRFPEGPGTQGFFAPTRFEAELRDCVVEGEIPKGLEGAFYRVGPNRVYPPRYPDDIPYNGDGMASVFRFTGGRVDYAQRYIETERYTLERAAGRALFGRYRNRASNDPSVPATASLGTANTHIVWRGGRLMALKEDSPPVLLDPATLDTLDARYDFDGQLDALTFTAHPKIDPDTDDMVAFAYEARGDASRDIEVMSFDRSGRKTWEAWIEAPQVSMMHDMAATPNWVLIPTTGLTTSAERLASGALHWAYDPSLEICLAVVPRGGKGSDARWIKAPSCCLVHTIAATERADGTLVLDCQASDGNGIPSFPKVDGSPSDLAGAASALRRWNIDLDGEGTILEERICPEIKSALPRIDDRYLFRGPRYGYSAESGLRSATPYNAAAAEALKTASSALARFDLETGEVAAAPLGPSRNAAEPVFAPRGPDAPEGDGWLLAVASDFARMRSELVILDAARLEAGVIARVVLPFRAHLQVHGSWVPRWELDAPASAAKR